MKKTIFAVAAYLSSSHLMAQIDSAKTLDPVVVSASKFPQKQSTTGKVVRVISREELAANPTRSLAQLLNEQAGVTVNGINNAPGTNPTLYLRGAGSAHTLILVDGVPVQDASGISGEFDLNHFSVDQIERVEILMGAESVLYGADASAGVVQIITRKAADTNKINGGGLMAGGSYETLKAAAWLGGKGKNTWYQLSYNHLQSAGFSAAVANAQADKDGILQNNFDVQLGGSWCNNWSWRTFGRFQQYRADADDAAFADDRNNSFRHTNWQVGVQTQYQRATTKFVFQAALNKINRKLTDDLNSPALPGDYDPSYGIYKGNSFFSEAYLSLGLHKNWNWLIGTDLRTQQSDIETTYGKLASDSLHASQFSMYSSVFFNNGKGLSAGTGFRITHHSQTGAAVTWSFNPSYLIQKRWKIFANLSTGFRAPTLYNLASEYGNPSLKPEHSFSTEAGLQYLDPSGAITSRVTWFHRTIRDIIIFKPVFVPPYGVYDNADQQKDHGLEAEFRWQPVPAFGASVQYTYVNGHLVTAGASGADSLVYNLYRRPKHTVHLNVHYSPFKAFNARFGLRWVDRRNDLYFNMNTYQSEIVVLKSYFLADLNLNYQWKSGIQFFADFQNITNTRYTDVYGYNTRRFNVMAGAQIRF